MTIILDSSSILRASANVSEVEIFNLKKYGNTSPLDGHGRKMRKRNYGISWPHSRPRRLVI